ncbi:MAG: hypothetical protein QW521_03670 [Desulfurococcaceae archaeon]
MIPLVDVEEVKEIEEVTELSSAYEGVAKAKITRILKGKLKNLIDIQSIRNEELKTRYEKQANRDAIMLELDVGGITIRRVLVVSLRKNSRFYKLMRKYKKIRVGDEIDVMIMPSGRIQIVYE